MIIKIKDKLKDNTECIERLLVKLEFHNIKLNNKDQFVFGFDDKGKGTGNFLNIHTLLFYSFSGHNKGDIITLVAEKLDTTDGKAIKWLCKELNISYSYNPVSVDLPFGGFFKKYTKVKEIDETPPITYPDSRLYEFNYGVSKLWIDDGISAITQEIFGVGYDILTNRITYPWLNECGDLIGIMGRLNTIEVKDWQNKYLPIISFNKSKALYGLYQNYKNILNSNYIIICESEKSVMKGYEKGIYNVVAIGCKNISQRQANLIKSMYCNVIIALDEGVEMKHSIEQAQKVQISNPFFSNEVYVLDTTGLDTKSSLLDTDKGTIDKYLKNNLIYIDKE